MGIREERRILQIACGTHPEVPEGCSRGMDLSELCGMDTEAGKRERNRRMVQNGDCFGLKEKKAVGRRSSYS